MTSSKAVDILTPASVSLFYHGKGPLNASQQFNLVEHRLRSCLEREGGREYVGREVKHLVQLRVKIAVGCMKFLVNQIMHVCVSTIDSREKKDACGACCS